MHIFTWSINKFRFNSFFIQEQDAAHIVVIKDLVKRDADSCIFQRLKMSYGQAVRFKAEFSYLLPPKKDVKTSVKKHSQPPLKPTMGQLS